MLWIAQYRIEHNLDGSIDALCTTEVEDFGSAFFFIGTIVVFFILPFLVLLVLYTVIALHLMNNPSITSHANRSNVLKYRKQVIFMLGAVVISFFICLLPFRAFVLWIIITPKETVIEASTFYAILHFSRTLVYTNSALNPILYNLMSSKFREGFLKVLGCKSVVRHKLFLGTRKGTFHTTSTNLSSSQSGDKRRSEKIKDDSETITGSIVIKNGIDDILLISSDSERSNSISLEAKRNGFAKRKRSTFEDIDEIEEIGSVKVADDEDIDGATTSTNRKYIKEVYFGHQNGRNGCNANRRRSSPGLTAHSKTKLLSAMANKHSDSIDSSTDEVECGSNIQARIYETRFDCKSNDESETKSFIPHSIGAESFV